MAGNQITLTLAGDSKSLERTFDRVGAGAKDMAGDLNSASADAKKFGSSMDNVGASVGGAEGKFMGTADLLDGLGSAFGLPTDQAVGLTRAFGDLSGGFEVVQGFLTSGLGKVKDFAAAIVHSSVVTKAWTGIQAAFNAVMALNPAILIGAAIVALGVALVVAYQKSETFRNIVNGALNAVKGVAETLANFFTGLPGKLWGIAGAIKDALLWPYKTAFNLIAKAWNNTVGRISFQAPDWVPGLGGKGFSVPKIPEFHTGGIVPGTPGSEVPIMALAGERVSPLAQSRNGDGSGLTVIVQGNVLDGRQLGQLVRNALVSERGRSGSIAHLI
jgi:hypothetical protein